MSSRDSAEQNVCYLCDEFSKINLMLNKSKTKLLIRHIKKGDQSNFQSTLKSHISFVKQRIVSLNYLFFLSLKRIGYSKIELFFLYRFLVTSVVAYYCSVWVVAANYHLDELDGCQKKAVGIGFIDKIMDIGTAHPLHNFVPK